MVASVILIPMRKTRAYSCFCIWTDRKQSCNLFRSRPLIVVGS
jgi:hypothetical protein